MTSLPLVHTMQKETVLLLRVWQSRHSVFLEVRCGSVYCSRHFIPPGRVCPTDSVPLDGMRLVGGGLHSARVVFSLSPSLACGGALGLGVGPGVRSVHQHEQTVCKGRAGLQGTDKFLGWSRAQFFINHPSKLAGCLAMGRNDSSSALPKVPGRRKGRAEGPVDLGPKPLSTNLPVTLGRIILSG